MKAYLVRSLFAFVLAVAFLLPEASGAQAASWHAPLGWRWTIQPVCRDGVEIIVRLHPSDDPTSNAAVSFLFYAYQVNSPPTGPSLPLKITGALSPVGRYGSVLVSAENRRPTRLYWTDDEAGTQGTAYVYGKARLKWRPLLSGQKRLLPLGTPVAVRRDGNLTAYFLGGVTDCYLFQ